MNELYRLLKGLFYIFVSPLLAWGLFMGAIVFIAWGWLKLFGTEEEA